jgi:UDP-N-acetylglucosamine--N-acetylmuramyl-(pentapeptide) pyrophosphoryl-undecaprenol N-acetylglucosamine transferase
MGSLGSSKMNDFFVDTMDKFKFKDYEVVFVTGKDAYENIKTKKFSSNVKVLPYIDNMTRLLKKTDVVVSRAGASTLSEIIALRIPSVLIPSPYVANNHQYYNALDLVNKGISILIEEKDLNESTLTDAINNIFEESTIKEIKDNLKKIKDTSSSTIIMQEIMNRLKGKDEKKEEKI